MNKIFILLLSLISFSLSSFAQKEMATLKEMESGILAQLIDNKDVSITQLTSNMLRKITKGKADSPLGILAKDGHLMTVRLYEFGSKEAEKLGRQLLTNALAQKALSNNAKPEILVKQSDGSGEVLIYGVPDNAYRTFFRSLMIFSRQNGKKTVLIDIDGTVMDGTVGELINSFSKD